MSEERRSAEVRYYPHTMTYGPVFQRSDCCSSPNYGPASMGKYNGDWSNNLINRGFQVLLRTSLASQYDSTPFTLNIK